jgi:Mg-chelatase subunit ChlI
LVILRGAQAHAAFQGRDHITDDDIILAAELALPHRVKGRPLQNQAITADTLSETLEDVQNEIGADGGEEMDDDSQLESGAEKKKL